AVGVLIYFVVLLYMLKKETLILKYTLLWILGGFALILFLIFPDIVFSLSSLIGISNPVNAVFLMFAFMTIMLLLSLTAIVSQITDRQRKLIQAVALLEERLRRVEESKDDLQ
ncbi:MAG: DUF2304 domain-containing protein, partial [Oscillospiraceae bacterium]